MIIAGDESLVNDLQNVMINGKEKPFYSFATKYCSHHRPLDFPIYDSYVDAVLRYYRDKDHFCDFGRNDLKNYACFKKTMINFQSCYGLERHNLKEIDKFLLQLGKDFRRSIINCLNIFFAHDNIVFAYEECARDKPCDRTATCRKVRC